MCIIRYRACPFHTRTFRRKRVDVRARLSDRCTRAHVSIPSPPQHAQQPYVGVGVFGHYQVYDFRVYDFRAYDFRVYDFRVYVYSGLMGLRV